MASKFISLLFGWTSFLLLIGVIPTQAQDATLSTPICPPTPWNNSFTKQSLVKLTNSEGTCIFEYGITECSLSPKLCPAGKMCTMKKLPCPEKIECHIESASCEDDFTMCETVAEVCDTVECKESGYILDNNSCKTCHCNNPCKELKCETNCVEYNNTPGSPNKFKCKDA